MKKLDENDVVVVVLAVLGVFMMLAGCLLDQIIGLTAGGMVGASGAVFTVLFGGGLFGRWIGSRFTIRSRWAWMAETLPSALFAGATVEVVVTFIVMLVLGIAKGPEMVLLVAEIGGGLFLLILAASFVLKGMKHTMKIPVEHRRRKPTPPAPMFPVPGDPTRPRDPPENPPN